MDTQKKKKIKNERRTKQTKGKIPLNERKLKKTKPYTEMAGENAMTKRDKNEELWEFSSKATGWKRND